MSSIYTLKDSLDSNHTMAIGFSLLLFEVKEIWGTCRRKRNVPFKTKNDNVRQEYQLVADRYQRSRG